MKKLRALMSKKAFTVIAVLVGAVSFAQPVAAATAYYATATDVYVRPRPQSYAMGRLYNHTNTSQGRMDVQYVDSNGWAYGYAYGYVNRCVWAQYSYRDDAGVSRTNFRTNGTTVSNKCRTTNIYLENSEFTSGEIWSNASGTDGEIRTITRESQTWDNWSWGNRTGNNNYRGVTPAGSKWKLRYTTNDGAGVMARPCSTNSSGVLSCASDWYFILRSAL